MTGFISSTCQLPNRIPKCKINFFFSSVLDCNILLLLLIHKNMFCSFFQTILVALTIVCLWLALVTGLSPYFEPFLSSSCLHLIFYLPQCFANPFKTWIFFFSQMFWAFQLNVLSQSIKQLLLMMVSDLMFVIIVLYFVFWLLLKKTKMQCYILLRPGLFCFAQTAVGGCFPMHSCNDWCSGIQ